MALTEETKLLIRLTAEDATKQAFGAINKSLGGLATTAAKVAAVVGSALAFKDAIDTTRRWNKELDLLVDTLGATGEEAARLNYIGRVVGLTAEDTASSFGLLSRKLAEQQKQIHQGTSDFDKWGVKVTDASGNILAFDDILGNVNETVGKMPSGLAKTAALMDLFGRSGKQMHDLVSLSREEIAELVDDVDKLGLSMSTAGVAAAERYERQFNRLGLAFDALKITLGNELMPLLAELIRNFVIWVKDVLPRLREMLGPIVSGIASMAMAVYNLFTAVGRVIGAVLRLITGERDLANVTKVWGEALRRIASFLKEVADAADRFAKLIGEEGLLAALKQLGSDIISKIGEGLGEVGSWVTDNLPKWIVEIKKFFTDTLPTWLDGLASMIGKGAEWLRETGIPRLAAGLQEWFPRLVEFGIQSEAFMLSEILPRLVRPAGDIGKQIGATILVAWLEVWRITVGPFLQGLLDYTVNPLIDAINTVIGALNRIPGVHIPLVAHIDVNAFVAAAEAAINDAARDRTSLITVITDESQRRGERSGGAAVGATRADIVSAYQTYLGRDPENEGAITGRLGMDLAQVIAGIAGSQEAQNRNRTQGYASGGIVPARPGGTLVTVGEGEYDEAIVPLRRGGGMGSTVINLTFSNNIGLDERGLARMVSDEIMAALGRVRGLAY